MRFKSNDLYLYIFRIAKKCCNCAADLFNWNSLGLHNKTVVLKAFDELIDGENIF